MLHRSIRIAAALIGVAVLTGASATPELLTCPAVSATGPEYYAIELVGTKRIPGMGRARGRADVSVAAAAPFSVSLTPDGSYLYDVNVSLTGMRPPRNGVLVAWITTSELDGVKRIGALDETLQIAGTASWNKFLVVVTLEVEDDPSAERWTGLVAFRGMSRSGMMHTMAGHGPFQQENCAAYGYDE